MYISTITSKGQTTIPRYIRKKLNLISGDNIEFYVNNDNSITLVNNNLEELLNYHCLHKIQYYHLKLD